MLERLREQVCAANQRLIAECLVTLTWGNVSGIDRDKSVIAIKPSGVDYDQLQPADIVLVDLQGAVVEGELRPSSDTPTHLELYRRFPGVGGIVHTHSRYATTMAQARLPIPCTGTTHADHFDGEVPVTRTLTPAEVARGYEHETGVLIAETFDLLGLDPARVPAVLLAGHAPFAWGASVQKAMDNAVALEAVAEMTLHLHAMGKSIPLEPHVLEKHQSRKHGPNAYYGQNKQ